MRHTELSGSYLPDYAGQQLAAVLLGLLQSADRMF